nr:sodium/calcium exchanger NCL2-like [Tanacetum cinerariifolium]
FFERIDSNEDESITPAELKNFIMREEILVDVEIADIILRHLDVDGDGGIDKYEFKAGVKKLLNSRNLHKHSPESNGLNDRYHRAEAKAKAVEKIKAITLLFVGIFILMALAEPLVESVRKFSESVDIEPFYVSFILVPLATNARTAMAAILAAKQKRHHTTSLTFSEELLKEDGTQDESAIDSFFERIDSNEDESITPAELKNFIMREEILVDVEIADIILRHLDVDGDGGIDKYEFKAGVKKLLNSLPLATNARTAMAAILAAKQKRHHTTSLTFSEVCPSIDYNFNTIIGGHLGGSDSLGNGS